MAKSLGTLRHEQALHPELVTKDAGADLGAGIRACGSGVNELDDLFHAVYKMGREADRLAQAAYRAMSHVEDLLHKSARAKTEPQRQSLGQKRRRARVHTVAAINRCDDFEALRREAQEELEHRDRGRGVLRISKDMMELGGKRSRSIGRYLGHRAKGLGRCRGPAPDPRRGGRRARGRRGRSPPDLLEHADPTVGALEGALGARAAHGGESGGLADPAGLPSQ